MLVDKLCEPGDTYKQIKRHITINGISATNCDCDIFFRLLESCGVTSSSVNPEDLMNPNSKLSSQQLYKLGVRLVYKYNLELGEPAGTHTYTHTHKTHTHSHSATHAHSFFHHQNLFRTCAETFPHLFKRKAGASLHHMLQSKYVEVCTM